MLIGTLGRYDLIQSLGTMLLKFPAMLLDAGWPVLEWLAQQPLAVWYAPQPSLP